MPRPKDPSLSGAVAGGLVGATQSKEMATIGALVGAFLAPKKLSLFDSVSRLLASQSQQLVRFHLVEVDSGHELMVVTLSGNAGTHTLFAKAPIDLGQDERHDRLYDLFREKLSEVLSLNPIPTAQLGSG